MGRKCLFASKTSGRRSSLIVDVIVDLLEKLKNGVFSGFAGVIATNFAMCAGDIDNAIDLLQRRSDKDKRLPTEQLVFTKDKRDRLCLASDPSLKSTNRRNSPTYRFALFMSSNQKLCKKNFFYLRLCNTSLASGGFRRTEDFIAAK